jgi:aspartate/methionine/tyrosine aminotransferase
MDEFYSHYIWSAGPSIVSAAAHVEDVDRDPVVLVDGLTKNWRYPGWRVTWLVGPKRFIEASTSAGSFLDGGGSHPMQRAAVDLLDPDGVLRETDAIHRTFGAKRRTLVDGLRALGVKLDLEPEGTFYAWGDLGGLPTSIRDGNAFFEAALAKKVIVVPGEFFDVDPGNRRHGRPSRFRQHVRFSFGPSATVLQTALARLAEVVRGAT